MLEKTWAKGVAVGAGYPTGVTSLCQARRQEGALLLQQLDR
jgi:hypothetical protein